MIIHIRVEYYQLGVWFFSPLERRRSNMARVVAIMAHGERTFDAQEILDSLLQSSSVYYGRRTADPRARTLGGNFQFTLSRNDRVSSEFDRIRGGIIR